MAGSVPPCMRVIGERMDESWGPGGKVLQGGIVCFRFIPGSRERWPSPFGAGMIPPSAEGAVKIKPDSN